MKKKLIGMLLLSLVLCTGCTIVNAEPEPHEAGYNLTTGSYFDISDLTEEGTSIRNIGEIYGFSELTETDTKYLSADRDTYTFDEQGRLVMYVNAEPTRRNLPATISEEKALEIAFDVLSCCGLNPEEFQKTYLSYASENSTYYITLEKAYSVGISDTVQFCIRSDGVLETVTIHYQHCDPLTPEQEAYFQEQLTSAMAERLERGLTGYSETVRYYSDKKKIL